MAWSPHSPVRTSHGHNRSLSFDLSPSISKAVGAPFVATHMATPERHGLLHSPHDYDLSEKVRAKKIVAEAMRGNTKLRQAVAELSMISATETTGKASKKQRTGTSRIADRRARSASGGSEPKASSSTQSWDWVMERSQPNSANPGSSTARSRRVDSGGRDTPVDRDSDEESERRRKPRSASLSGSAGTRAGRADRGNPSSSSTPRSSKPAASTRTNRVVKPPISKFAESNTSKRTPSTSTNSRPPTLPSYGRQEHSRSPRGPRSSVSPDRADDSDESQNLDLLREREKARLAQNMLKQTEQEAERILLMVTQEHRRDKQETEQRAYQTLEEHGAWTSKQVAASEQRAREQEQEAAERISRTEREADERCRKLRHHAEDIVRDLQNRMKAMEVTVQSVGEKEKIELMSELQGLKHEERSEETQAQVLVSKSELLQEEFAKERDNLVQQLQTRIMVEREREREYGTAPGKGRPRSRSL